MSILKINNAIRNGISVYISIKTVALLTIGVFLSEIKKVFSLVKISYNWVLYLYIHFKCSIIAKFDFIFLSLRIS